MARRLLAVSALTLAVLGLTAFPALAECSGGLIEPGHTAALVRTTSLVCRLQNGFTTVDLLDD